MKFPEKIDFLIKEKGVNSLRQVAEEIGIPYSTLWDYYSNNERLEKAGISKIKKIANYFGCTTDYLAYDEVQDPQGSLNNSNDQHSNTDNFDELELLFDKNKDILTDEDKEYMRFIIEKRRREIDKQLGDE